MRLRLIIYAILYLLLVSGCEKDPLLGKTGRQPMRFSSAEVSIETKANEKPNDPTVLISVGNQVSLYGLRRVNNTDTPVFSNQILSCTAAGNNPTWEYNPLEYWEETGDYYFAGVFPYRYSDISITSTNNTYTLSVVYRAGDNQDLMVAREHRDVTESNGKRAVSLPFKHVTSAIRFIFRKDASITSECKLTDFRLENLYANGTLSCNPLNYNGADDWSWTQSTRGTLCSWSAATTEARKLIGPKTGGDHPENNWCYMGWYYMVPQSMGASPTVHFSISYDGQTPVTKTLDITDCDGDANHAADIWAPNQVYNYYITINASGLTLTVEATPWDQVTVTTDVITFES